MHTVDALEGLESRRLLTSLTAGVTYATAVSIRRPVKNWTIHLTAGQAVYVAAGTSGDTLFAPRLSLITPDHTTLARSADGRGAMIAETAPVTGIYTVRVRDNAGRTTAGDLRVTAVFTGRTLVTDGDDGRTPISGDSYTASIEPGDLDVWRIDATAREFVEGIIVSTSARRPIGVGYALVKPDGAETDKDEQDVGDGLGSAASEYFALNGREAVQAGTYYAIVYEPSANASGRYAFGIAAASGKQSKNDVNTKQPLTSGNSTRIGNLSVANFDVFQVTPPNGRSFTIEADNTDSNIYERGAPAVQLIDATGRDVTDDYLNGGSGEDTDAAFVVTPEAGAVAPFYAIVGAGPHAYTLYCSFG